MSTAPAFSILGLDHVVVVTADMERSLAFYCDVLGMAEARRVESIGLVQLRAGASLIDVLPAKDGPVGRNMDHFAIRIEPWDADAILAYLKAAGCAPGAPALRNGAEGEGWSIYVDDPDGNTVELKGPALA